MKKNNTKRKTTYRKNVKERAVLSFMVDQRIDVVGNFVSFGKTTLSEGFPKDTLLLCNLHLKVGEHICQHIWIRADEIRNFEEYKDSFKKNCKVYFEAIPYGYGDSRSGKIRRRKYSLGNISIKDVIKY